MGFTKAQEVDIQKITKNSIKECFADSDFVDMFATKFATAITKNLEQQINELSLKCTNLENMVQDLQSVNNNLSNKLDMLEQSQKESAVRIYGVPETKARNKNENLLNVLQENVFAKFPDVHISEDYIHKMYRIGKNVNKNTPRAIYVEFYSKYHSSALVRNRKVLKNTKIFLVEDLTKTRYGLLTLAKEKFGKTNAWSLRGKIHIKKNDNVHIIHNKEDLERILQ